MNLLQRITIVVAVYSLTACGAGDRTSSGWAGTVDTLAGGTVVVYNPAEGLWTPEEVWRVSEELRIGTAFGDGSDVFAQVHDIAVDGLGRIYVLDQQVDQIAVFDPDGRHLRTLGGSGAGPGEMENPRGMDWGSADYLWIVDPGNGRYIAYDTAGKFVDNRTRTIGGFSYSWGGGADSEGFLYDTGFLFSEDTEPERILLRVDSSGTPIDTFPLPKFESLTYTLVEDGATRMASTVPYSPRLHWLLSESGLWFGSSDRYRIVQRTLEGDTLRIIDRPYEPIPVQDEERERALERDFLQRMRDAGADVDPGLVPDHKPAFQAFLITSGGYVWVRPTPADTSGGTRYDVFNPKGRYLGRVGLPVDISTRPTPIIKNGNLYGVTRDELGIEYVMRFGVERSGS